MARLRIRVVADGTTPFLTKLSSMISRKGTAADKALLNDAVATEAELTTRKYLRDLHRDPSRHKTADKLGAPHSGHFQRAADDVSSGFDHRSAWVEMNKVFGLSRAFRDFDIKPVKAKRLTIPAHKSAYAKRAREFSDLRLVVFGKTGKMALFRKGSDGKQILMYWLVERAKIKKDRTLLPADEDFNNAAERGARQAIRELQRRVGNG